MEPHYQGGRQKIQPSATLTLIPLMWAQFQRWCQGTSSRSLAPSCGLKPLAQQEQVWERFHRVPGDGSPERVWHRAWRGAAYLQDHYWTSWRAGWRRKRSGRRLQILVHADDCQ